MPRAGSFLAFGNGRVYKRQLFGMTKVDADVFILCHILCNFNLASVTVQRGQNHSEFVL